jgi:polysaccharide export outer membrane protein
MDTNPLLRRQDSPVASRLSHVPWRSIVGTALAIALLATQAPHGFGSPPVAQSTDHIQAEYAAGECASDLFAAPVCDGGFGEPCRACPIQGVDCADQDCGELPWSQSRPLPWQVFAHGEYVGPPRPSHVPKYVLRVDDEITFVFRLTREESSRPYTLNVGDRVRVESLSDKDLDRDLIVQPDGTIIARLVGAIRAAGRTVVELQKELEEKYLEYYQNPAITVTPIEVDTKLSDLRNTVDNRQGAGGQSVRVSVAPDGTVQRPAIGSVPVQGLTLDELKLEIDERYRMVVQSGIEVTPVLTRRAPRFIYIVGEVAQPGRFELTGPTTAMQAIALAGGWNNGGNLRQIVVFRRAEDWRLIATRLDLRGALYGKRPIPSDEIWLRDSDIVVVPKTPLQRTDDLIELLFTRGINELIPLATGLRVLEPSRF